MYIIVNDYRKQMEMALQNKRNEFMSIQLEVCLPCLGKIALCFANKRIKAYVKLNAKSSILSSAVFFFLSRRPRHHSTFIHRRQASSRWPSG